MDSNHDSENDSIYDTELNKTNGRRVAPRQLKIELGQCPSKHNRLNQDGNYLYSIHY